MGQSISFLQGLIEKDPTNKALIDAYVELCKKDADMSNAAEERSMKIMENAANERVNLIKQDVECYKKQSDTMLSVQKSMLEANNPAPNWMYYSYLFYAPVQGLTPINRPPSRW